MRSWLESNLGGRRGVKRQRSPRRASHRRSISELRLALRPALRNIAGAPVGALAGTSPASRLRPPADVPAGQPLLRGRFGASDLGAVACRRCGAFVPFAGAPGASAPRSLSWKFEPLALLAVPGIAGASAVRSSSPALRLAPQCSCWKRMAMQGLGPSLDALTHWPLERGLEPSIASGVPACTARRWRSVAGTPRHHWRSRRQARRGLSSPHPRPRRRSEAGGCRPAPRPRGPLRRPPVPRHLDPST